MSARIPVDGLDALRAEIGLKEIGTLIERTARWVAPETFRYLPIWFPEHARRKYFYKANWSEPQLNQSRATGKAVHKVEGNVYANQALTLALGLRKKERPNWSCCHIWGIDDATFQRSNAIVSDHRYYSCIANMVLLPTPLKAFTDTMPDVKAMIRICARNLYGWQCQPEMDAVNHELNNWNDWRAYPSSWPRSPEDRQAPRGIVPFTPEIKAAADRRLKDIRRDLQNAGNFYPHHEVQKALKYWNISEST